MSIVDEITRLTSAKANIKAAIEAKGVSVPSSAHLDAFPSFVSAISAGGGAGQEDGLIEGTLNSYTNSRVSYIRQAGFARTNIKYLDFPNVTSLGPFAFDSATGGVLKLPNLTYSSTSFSISCFASASFSRIELDAMVSMPGSFFYTARSVREVYAPNLQNVGQFAFAGCSLLESVPNASDIRWTANSAFRGCGFSEVRAPKFRGANPYAFAACSQLTLVSLDSASYINGYAFQNCSKLVSFYSPSTSYISIGSFQSCYALSDVSIPYCGRIGSSAFTRCSSLSTLILPKCSWIDPGAFMSCTTLFSLYMLSSSVATLYLSSAFANTPIAASVDGVYGSIFVPQSLLATYQSRTQWVVFSNRFVGLTDEEIAALPF